MGLLLSRRSEPVQTVALQQHAYKYPPKSGNYFGSHFILGGDKFEMLQPEGYLFGENSDLNFLGDRPVPFPYPAPQSAHEPSRVLKALVNVRKDSLRLQRLNEDDNSPVVGCEANNENDDDDDEEDAEAAAAAAAAGGQTDLRNAVPMKSTSSYNIEFTFDADAKCAITLYYLAREVTVDGQLTYQSRAPEMTSEKLVFKKGANQVFQLSTHRLCPGLFSEETWQYGDAKEEIPIVIHCVVEDEEVGVSQSHATFACLERTSDGHHVVKGFKQKLMLDGVCYLLQEIYGIENKTVVEAKRAIEDEMLDNADECVICMSELRDTLILPCRHLCLCTACAESLRTQENNCPICRSHFRALLNIRALRRQTNTENDEPTEPGIPTGYEAVALLEALNGYMGAQVPTRPGSSQLRKRTAEDRKRSISSVHSLRGRSGRKTTVQDPPPANQEDDEGVVTLTTSEPIEQPCKESRDDPETALEVDLKEEILQKLDVIDETVQQISTDQVNENDMSKGETETIAKELHAPTGVDEEAPPEYQEKEPAVAEIPPVVTAASSEETVDAEHDNQENMPLMSNSTQEASAPKDEEHLV